MRFAAILTAMLVPFAATAYSAPVKDKSNPDSKVDPFPDIDSDALLLIHLRASDLWSSPLFKDLLARATKTEAGRELLKDLEKSVRKEIGCWPLDFESATLCVVGFSKEGHEPVAIVVLNATKPIDKEQLFMPIRKGESNRKGFISLAEGYLLHFPDDRTAVLIHDEVVEPYLAGYAKDKSKWPMSASLKKAAENNTLVMNLRLSRLPDDIRKELDKEAPALSAAKQFTVAGNLNGNEIRLEIRASFPNETIAKNAAAESTKFLGELAEELAKELQRERLIADLGSAIGLLKELHRAIKEVKVELYGPDAIAKTSYKVDLPIEKIVVEFAEKRRRWAERGESQNNLKHIGLAIHNYANANGGGDQLLISGTDAKGAPIKKLGDKTLLSWRVAMLPYIEQGQLYNKFKHDEPWDSEHNKKLIPLMPKIFAPTNNVKAPEGQTFYQMVLGPKAMRPGFTIGTIPDGTSNTIAVAEAAESVIWTKPDDVFIPGKDMPKDLKKKFGGLCKGGFNVLMFDGSVRWVDAMKVSDRSLWIAIQPDDGEPLPQDWIE